MAKRKFSLLILAVCVLLAVSILCGCNNIPSESVGDDGNGTLNEKNASTDNNGMVNNPSENTDDNNGNSTQNTDVNSNDGLTQDGIALDEATQREIITAFVNAHSQDYYPVTEDEISLRCYGAFDGVYVLFVDVASWGNADVVTTETIAGLYFNYPNGQTMEVYSDGVFYTLAEAYENGILSYDNLLTTQQNYKARHEYLYQEDDVGNSTKGIALSREIQREIITAFVNAHSQDVSPVTEDEISLRCFGAFDGVYVLFVDGDFEHNDLAITEVIAGLNFNYPDGRRMTVYCDNAFYTISEAYENGILSYDNLLATQQTYNACYSIADDDYWGKIIESI